MQKSTLQRLNMLGDDYLSLFEGEAATAAAPNAPQSTTQFDPNDPAVQAAMAKAREQERNAHHANLQREREARAKAESDLQSLNERVKAMEEAQSQRAAAEQQEYLDSLKGNEKIQAQLELMQQQLEQSEQRNQALTDAANQRIEAWQIQARVNEVMAQSQGNIDPHVLDKSSMEALEASIPKAVQAYRDAEAFFRGKILAEQQQMSGGNQALVEGLRSAPPAQGFPSSNQASTPAPAQAGQPQQFTHPQTDGGHSYAQVRQSLHGRIYEAAQQPPAQGNFFQPTHPQHTQQPGQVFQPQGHPTGPVQNPNYQTPASPQQQMQPGGQPAQGPTTVQLVAPLPDDATRVSKGNGRALTQDEIHAAREHAAGISQRARQQPNTLRGVDTKGQPLSAEALGGGAPGQAPASGPTNVNMIDNAAHHPMNRNGYQR